MVKEIILIKDNQKWLSVNERGQARPEVHINLFRWGAWSPIIIIYRRFKPGGGIRANAGKPEYQGEQEAVPTNNGQSNGNRVFPKKSSQGNMGFKDLFQLTDRPKRDIFQGLSSAELWFQGNYDLRGPARSAQQGLIPRVAHVAEAKEGSTDLSDRSGRGDLGSGGDSPKPGRLDYLR